MEAMPALVAREIEKSFVEGPETVRVLHGVSLELTAGEIVALEGPSGSGKTTLLCILGCILTATRGQLVLAGHKVSSKFPDKLAALRKRAVGFVFQQYNLFPALTALENVEYALNIKGTDGREARDEAERLLCEVGLADRLHFLPRDMSGGQKQRVAIARGFAGSSTVLLADEPTANLDSTLGGQVLELFREQAKTKNKALLIVTHDPSVRRICDRVLQIRDGRLSS
jgi:putative ABC transport system ATP-binding protein